MGLQTANRTEVINVYQKAIYLIYVMGKKLTRGPRGKVVLVPLNANF